MKYAIITGATGSIGSTLCELLVNNGYYVYAIIRPNSPHINNLLKNDSVEIIECDIKDLSLLKNKIKNKCDIFYHLAWDGVRKEERCSSLIQSSNVIYTLEAIELAKSLGCDTFIGAGSQAEYGPQNSVIDENTMPEPNTEYGKYKLEAHIKGKELCESLNIKFFYPRIFSVYGPKDNDYTMIKSTLKKMINNEPINFTEGIQLWEYIYTDDCAKALYLIGTKGIKNHEYNISSKDTRPLKDFIIRMKELSNSTSKLYFGVIPYTYPIINLNSNINSLEDDLGFKEDYDFDKGINTILKKLKK